MGRKGRRRIGSGRTVAIAVVTFVTPTLARAEFCPPQREERTALFHDAPADAPLRARWCVEKRGDVDVADGPYESTFADGRTYRTGHFKNGKATSVWTEYAPEGHRTVVATFRDGRPVGTLRRYGTGGSTLLEGSFHDGAPAGLWRVTEADLSISFGEVDRHGRKTGVWNVHDLEGRVSQVRYRSVRERVISAAMGTVFAATGISLGATTVSLIGSIGVGALLSGAALPPLLMLAGLTAVGMVILGGAIAYDATRTRTVEAAGSNVSRAAESRAVSLYPAPQAPGAGVGTRR